LFFEVDGDNCVQSIDEVTCGKLIVNEGESMFLVALIGAEEFASTTFDVEEFVGFTEVGNIEAANCEGKLSGIIKGKLTGLEGIPSEEIPLCQWVKSCGVSLGKFAEAVIGYGFSGFGKGYFGANFYTCTVEDGIVAR
jgi:hypothetical protein